MSSLIRTSKSIPPVKLTWRGRLMLAYTRWRGPVAAGKTGVAVVRHRRGLRTTRRVVTVAGAVALIGGVVAVSRRRADTATPYPAT